jgi:hypothetical protein
LNEIEDRSKSKEKLLEEKEKIDAETQRSLAAAEMKRAHKMIDDIEKTRKLPAIRSVRQRIDAHMVSLAGLADMFRKLPFGRNPIYSDEIKESTIRNWQIYESIRYDFQKTLDIKEQDMEKLFPSIDLGFSFFLRLLSIALLCLSRICCCCLRFVLGAVCMLLWLRGLFCLLRVLLGLRLWLVLFCF